MYQVFAVSILVLLLGSNASGSQFPTPDECLVDIVTDGGWIDIHPAGTRCEFPFRVGDTVFNECATLEESRPFINGQNRDAWNVTSPTANPNRWCATVPVYDADEADDALRKQWGYCDCNSTAAPTASPVTPSPTSSPTQFVTIRDISEDGQWTISREYEDVNANPGDYIRFRYNSAHDVAIVPDETAYDKCDIGKAVIIGDTSEGEVNDGFLYPITDADQGKTIHMICTQANGGHCQANQKVRIIVSAGTTVQPTIRTVPPVTTELPTTATTTVPPTTNVTKALVPKYIGVTVRLVPVAASEDSKQRLNELPPNEVLDVSLLPQLFVNLFTVDLKQVVIADVEYLPSSNSKNDDASRLLGTVTQDLEFNVPKYVFPASSSEPVTSNSQHHETLVRHNHQSSTTTVQLYNYISLIKRRFLARDAFFLVRGGIVVSTQEQADSITERLAQLENNVVVRQLRDIQFQTSLEEWKIHETVPEKLLPNAVEKDDSMLWLAVALGILCVFLFVVIVAQIYAAQSSKTLTDTATPSELELGNLSTGSPTTIAQQPADSPNTRQQSGNEAQQWMCDFCGRKNVQSSPTCTDCNARKPTTKQSTPAPAIRYEPDSGKVTGLEAIAGGDQLAAAWTANIGNGEQSKNNSDNSNQPTPTPNVYHDTDSDDSDDIDLTGGAEGFPLTHVSSLAPQVSTGSMSPLNVEQQMFSPQSPTLHAVGPNINSNIVTNGQNKSSVPHLNTGADFTNATGSNGLSPTATKQFTSPNGGNVQAPGTMNNPFDTDTAASATQPPTRKVPGGMTFFDPLVSNDTTSPENIQVQLSSSSASVQVEIPKDEHEPQVVQSAKPSNTTDRMAPNLGDASSNGAVVPHQSQGEAWDQFEVETVSEDSSSEDDG